MEQTDFDWICIHGKTNFKETMPEEFLPSKEQHVDLGHDRVTGHSCLGNITVLSLPPDDWHCRSQNTATEMIARTQFKDDCCSVAKQKERRPQDCS